MVGARQISGERTHHTFLMLVIFSTLDGYRNSVGKDNIEW